MSVLTLLYLASCTSPTISMSRLSLPWSIRRPTGLAPRLNFLAKAWFTTATFGAPSASERVNSRPASTGMPTVVKYPAPTMLNRELSSTSGPLGKPSTPTSVPQLLPPMSGTMAADTPTTPGVCASSSSSRWNSCRERSAG